MDTRVRGVLAVVCLAAGTAHAERVTLSSPTGIVLSEWTKKAKENACPEKERWILHKIVMKGLVFSYGNGDITIDSQHDHLAADTFKMVDGDLVGTWDSDDRHVEVRVSKDHPWAAVVGHHTLIYKPIRIHMVFHPGTPAECEETWVGDGVVSP